MEYILIIKMLFLPFFFFFFFFFFNGFLSGNWIFLGRGLILTLRWDLCQNCGNTRSFLPTGPGCGSNPHFSSDPSCCSTSKCNFFFFATPLICRSSMGQGSNLSHSSDTSSLRLLGHQGAPLQVSLFSVVA